MEDDGIYYPELWKIQKLLEQCWLHIKSYRCVNIYEDNCCVAVLLEYHIIVSVWKPVAFCYSYRTYINITKRNQHSKVELIIISFNIGSRVKRHISKILAVKSFWKRFRQVLTLYKRRSFPLRISSVNVTKSDVLWGIWSHLLKKFLMENFFFVQCN